MFDEEVYQESLEAEELEAYIATAEAEFRLRVVEMDCDVCGIRNAGTAVILERNGWQVIGRKLCPVHKPLRTIGCDHGCGDFDTCQTIFGGGHTDIPF